MANTVSTVSAGRDHVDLMNAIQGPNTTVKTAIVEIAVPAGTTIQQFKFGTQDFLRNKLITSIEAYTVNDLTTSPNGNTLPTTANFQTAYLVLYGEDPELVNRDAYTQYYIPMWDLHNLVNSAADPYNNNKFTIVPQLIYFEKSFVQIGAALGNESTLSWLFKFSYVGVKET